MVLESELEELLLRKRKLRKEKLVGINAKQIKIKINIKANETTQSPQKS